MNSSLKKPGYVVSVAGFRDRRGRGTGFGARTEQLEGRLSIPGQECLGVNGLDVRIASEVTRVEGKNSLDAVDAHCRRQSRVVDLNARNVVTHKQGSPFLVDCDAVG